MRLDQKGKINRLVIYFFYDADGIVDRYVPYMLEDINKNCSELFVVCNGKLTSEGRATFQKYTSKVLVRENVGFDVWAYKEALEHYGWEKLGGVDEVIMMNYTIMGPLYPFAEMFEEMNQRDVDFWGITKHHGFGVDPFGTIPCGYIPEHIQSSFICVRNAMLCSPEFHSYWENMPEVNSYGEAVGKHEAIFTKKFEDFGFKSDVYVNTDDLKEYTHYPLMIDAIELIKNRKCPVFKRKSFSNEYYEFLDYTVGEPTIEAYEFIRDHCDYDIDMIWENILRVDNMADIKNRMHLNYILPRDEVLLPVQMSSLKIALIMHIYYEDQIENCIEYARSMPENADVIITTCSKENKTKIVSASLELSPRSVKVMMISNRGRDVSALLVAASPYVSDYDLICFAHDKKSTQMAPHSMGKSFAYKCLENVLGSGNYVKNIISTFEKEPRLGLLMPPPPNHASYFKVLGAEWGGNYGNYYNTVSLLKELSIKSKCEVGKEPISPLGTMFWFRPHALKPLFNKKWSYDDFPKEPNQNDETFLHAVERAYGFAAQSQGYYSAWCMHDKFAAMEITNYHFMLRETAISYQKALGFQLNFRIANEGFANLYSPRKIFKMGIKRLVPKPIWNFMKKVYHFFGGKKWVG